jgi:DNA polymerase elongation subunit (family B)
MSGRGTPSQTRNLWVGAEESSRGFQAIAAKQLMKAGVEVSAGQMVRYVITDAQNKAASRRVKAAELMDDGRCVDTEKYVEMLILAGANILSPFGYTEKGLKDRLVHGEKQMILVPMST